MCKLGTCRIYCLAQVSEVSPARTQYEFNPWLFVLNHRENLPLSDVKFIDQTQTHKLKPAEQRLGLQSSHLAWVEPCPRTITKGAQHSPSCYEGLPVFGEDAEVQIPNKNIEWERKILSISWRKQRKSDWCSGNEHVVHQESILILKFYSWTFFCGPELCLNIHLNFRCEDLIFPAMLCNESQDSFP